MPNRDLPQEHSHAETDRAFGERRWRLVVLVAAGLSILVAATAGYLLSSKTDVIESTGTAPSNPTPQVAAEHRGKDFEQMIAGLADRLASGSGQSEDWLLLARSYRTTGRYAKAAEAYAKSFELSGGIGTHRGEYAEVLIAAADGIVVPAASDLFEAVLADDPGDFRARYYLALAQAQSGRPEEAIRMWLALESELPADAPWASTVRAQIEDTARQAGQDVPPKAAASAKGPASGLAHVDVVDQAKLSEDQAEMIQGMVAGLEQRLESEPDDLTGWVRLGRSYLVLGQTGRARETLAKAVDLFPRDLDLLGLYAKASLSAGGDLPMPPAGTIELMRKRLAADPSDPNALWYVGLADARAGAYRSARSHWGRLLNDLDPGSLEHEVLKGYYDGLEVQSD
jgi:cytochrome c-type biogenesis protein CcmH